MSLVGHDMHAARRSMLPASTSANRSSYYYSRTQLRSAEGAIEQRAYAPAIFADARGREKVKKLIPFLRQGDRTRQHRRRSSVNFGGLFLPENMCMKN